MRKWCWLVSAVTVLLLLSWATHKFRQTSPMRQLEQELQRLRQAGEPTTFAELLPTVPPHQDGTPLYRHAIKQLDAVMSQLKQQTSLQAKLQVAQPALQTLRQALNFPHMRLTNWNVENPMDIVFPHFPKFREFARLLFAEGEWRKQKGDIDDAIESHMTALKLVRRISSEPSFIGFLVQGDIYATTFSGLKQVLYNADASLQTYQALMNELQAWEIDRDFVRALQAGRVLSIATCEWLQKKGSRRKLHDISTGPLEVNLAVWMEGRSNLIARNALRVLKYFEALITVARKGAPYDWKTIKQMKERWEREIDQPSWRVKLIRVELFWHENSIASYITPHPLFSFQDAASSHAMQRLAQTAVALRLYRHGHGRYPETLQELVPKYLPRVPIDPFDGKPLRYKRLQRGFKVWSVGENMKDDGGVKVIGVWRWRKGDIVWEAVK